MRKRNRLYSFMIALLLLSPINSIAQPADTRHKVDTLSFWDRFSVRTNGTDWVLCVPNVGVEYDLRNTNWNRYAVNVNLRYRPGASTVKVSPFVEELTEVKVEGRMYWRERQAESDGPMMYHLMPWDKLMSCRRMKPKHPNTVFYRGIYASYGHGAFRVSGDGYRGDFAQLGITWGFVKPLYAFPGGSSVDMEIGISGGAALVKSERFVVDEGKDCYTTTEEKDWHLLGMPVINELHAALVYRFGKYPIQKKYRWRYDVDRDYQSRIKDSWLARQESKSRRHISDSIYAVVSDYFTNAYDSVITSLRMQRQKLIDESVVASPTKVSKSKKDKEKKDRASKAARKED